MRNMRIPNGVDRENDIRLRVQKVRKISKQVERDIKAEETRALQVMSLLMNEEE